MSIAKVIESIVKGTIFFGSMGQMLLIVFKFMGNISYSWCAITSPIIIVFGIIFLSLAGIGFFSLRQTYVRIVELATQNRIAEMIEKGLIDNKGETNENENNERSS